MVTLQQLEYIVALDTHRHFAKAADVCFVTQPTLSMQIRKLEEQLDLRLFDRSRQPVVPTEAGKLIIEQARTVLREAARIPDLVNALRGEIIGQLRIGIIPSLAPSLIPLFAGPFTREYPAIDIQIIELVTAEILEELRKEQIDVGILVTPIEDPNFYFRPLFYEEIRIYAHQEHPYMKIPGITSADLRESDIWLMEEGHCFRNQMVNICRFKDDADKASHINYESGSLETLIALVDKEGGYTLLPELVYNNLPEDKLDQVLPIRDEAPVREVSLVYTRHFIKERLINALSDLLLSLIPENLKNPERGAVVEWENPLR